MTACTYVLCVVFVESEVVVGFSDGFRREFLRFGAKIVLVVGTR